MSNDAFNITEETEAKNIDVPTSTHLKTLFVAPISTCEVASDKNIVTVMTLKYKEPIISENKDI